jgi:hypothetical protein
MPRFRWKLTEAEQREYLILGEQLNAGGAMLDLSEFRSVEPTRFRICQTGEAYARSCTAGSVYVVKVSILCLVPLAVLENFYVRSREWELNAYLLPGPIERRPGEHIYQLLDKNVYYHDEVLNHRIGLERLRRGQKIEGLLLAQAYEKIPPKYKPADRMPIVLGIQDQFGSITERVVTLCVQPPLDTTPSRKVRESIVGKQEDAGTRASCSWVVVGEAGESESQRITK